MSNSLTCTLFARAALLPAVALGLGLGAATAQERADRIWSGGPILTMNDAAMRAEAVAEKGGRIIAVGKRDDVMKHRGPDTKLLDLQGRALLPGFVDAHGHIFLGGLQALSANMLAPPDGEVRDIASLQRILREWIAANEATVRRLGLIIGFGYDQAQLKELRHPTREDLDAVSTEFPILLVHQSGHLGAVNSKALDFAGVTAATPNPLGGVIRRKAGGQEPDGVLEETALIPVALKLLNKIGPEGGKTLARSGAELWARYGHTTAQEGRVVPAIAELIRQVGQEGGLKVDVPVYIDALSDRDYIVKSVRPGYTNRVRIAGAKLSIDGSPQGFTAWRDRPYYKPVGDYPKGYAGYPAARDQTIKDAIDWAYRNKIQILTHANGEKASDLLIASVREAGRKHGFGDRRPVLIHGQFLREDQVDAFKRLKVFPSLFPMHTYYWGDWHRDHVVGPVLAENISPTGWAVKRGMTFSTHHDAPVAFPDTMRVLAATVTRRTRSGDILGPNQRVDVITALKAMTIWPAWQHFEEKTKGSLEVGKLADFVVLSKDPTAVDPETLASLKIAETIKEGVSIYAATEAELNKASLDGPSPSIASLGLPDSPAGAAAFSNFIQRAAIDAELAMLPEAQARNPFIRTAIRAGKHDNACMSPALLAVAEAMLGGQASGGTETRR
jgi:predicted amidohydrolase YtcJ